MDPLPRIDILRNALANIESAQRTGILALLAIAAEQVSTVIKAMEDEDQEEGKSPEREKP